MDKLGWFVDHKNCITHSSMMNHASVINGEQLRIRQRNTKSNNCPCLDMQSDGCSSRVPSQAESRLRSELRYFFLNPCDKYNARKRKPYKLIIQLIKIVLVTTQLVIFGQSNQYVVGFMNDVVTNMRKNILPVESEIYKVDDFFTQIDFIRHQFLFLTNNSLGLYKYASFEGSGCDTSHLVNGGHHLLCFCLQEYTDIDVLNSTFSFDYKSQRQFCAALKPWSSNDKVLNETYHLPLLNGTMYKLDTNRLISAKLHFGAWTILLKNLYNPKQPDCFKLLGSISFNNALHSGKITRGINTTFHRDFCYPEKERLLLNGTLVSVFMLDCFIILICCTSILLCARSVWRAQRLRWSYERFYFHKHNKLVNWWEKLDFFNGWYFLIILSDILTVAGSVSKIVIDFRWKGVTNYDACSLFLGVGCLCVWIGVLRYVGYFHQYNILVLTLKRSLPHVLRFMVCASIMYLGFMFCGWVVLGPYHHKFRSPIVTSEALFSLLNGDDMYMTFEEMSHNSGLSWVFSQVYLYIFISLFIYIVLSLFIAVIMETYETIKEWQEKGFPPQTELQKFLNESKNEDGDEAYTMNDTYCCCCLYHNNHPEWQQTKREHSMENGLFASGISIHYSADSDEEPLIIA